MDKEKYYLILLVENNAGVLTRVSSLFCQRGFNIDTLTVASTDIEGISRITVSFCGNDKTLQQLIKQTEKLTETKMVISVEKDFGIFRELLLVKLETTPENISDIRNLAETHKFRIVDSSVGCVVLETTGEPAYIDLMLGLLEPYKIVEMCRTGVTALEKGKVTYKFN